MPHSDTY